MSLFFWKRNFPFARVLCAVHDAQIVVQNRNYYITPYEKIWHKKVSVEVTEILVTQGARLGSDCEKSMRK